MTPVTVKTGSGPVILSQPHCGLEFPQELRSGLSTKGRELSDTDWHVDRLYDGLLDSATIVRANFHRYVIDANRDPSGESLYPGMYTTDLVPLTTFDDEPLWDGTISDTEYADRLKFHEDYHRSLRQQVERVRSTFGIAVLFDCHSIRSEVPRLFDGELPDFNIGDNDGRTCANELTSTVEEVCRNASSYSYVVNGRFRGGWTVRHYGDPANGVHAIQMELSQKTYLASETIPYEFDETTANDVRLVLKTLLQKVEETAVRLSKIGESE